MHGCSDEALGLASAEPSDVANQGRMSLCGVRIRGLLNRCHHATLPLEAGPPQQYSRLSKFESHVFNRSWLSTRHASCHPPFGDI
jgi:hypothetical protein